MQQHILEHLRQIGKTIAVLGNGPRFVFPPQNKDIYEKILASGGAVISEYPGNIEPDSEKFRQRNRIVSGLSLGVLVVEAEKRSGTSITARYAEEQGKDIFCIPSSLKNRKGIGTNMLIQKGAKLALSPKDILDNYIKYNEIEQITIEDLEQMNNEKSIDLNKIKPEYREIYEILKEGLNINEISKKTNIDISTLYQKLFMMEIEGLIEVRQNKYKIKE